MIKHREENRPQVHAVDHGADEYSDQRRRLQPPQRRDHAEGEERGENEQRKEHVQPASPDHAQPPAQRAQGVEHQRERRAEKERREQRPRLLGNRQAHPKSRAKKPPPGAGSSA